MGRKKKIWQIAIITLLLILFALANISRQIIEVPLNQNLIDRELDFITISTVFAGFAFTALGLLMGFSSEKFIEKIKNTDIIPKELRNLIICIAYFILSVLVALINVLNLGKNFGKFQFIVNDISYILSIGYMIAGIIYFISAVIFLYNLITGIYKYNKIQINKEMELTKTEMENTRKKMKDYED